MNTQTDNIKMVGKVTLVHTKADGSIDTYNFNNLVVTTGKNFVASATLNASASPFTQIAIGSGTAAPAVTDTTLGTEVARVAFATSSVSGNTANMTATYGPGVGTGSVSEAGIFNAPSGGTMLSRVTFTAITKAAGDTLTAT